jgi:hypothetical protein
VTDNLLSTIWASAKTVQAKDQETLPVFPIFKKKPARTPINLRKSGLAKTHSTVHPIKSDSDKSLPTKHGPWNMGQKTQPAERAAKSGSPFYFGKRQAGYKCLPFRLFTTQFGCLFLGGWLFCSGFLSN